MAWTTLKVTSCHKNQFDDALQSGNVIHLSCNDAIRAFLYDVTQSWHFDYFDTMNKAKTPSENNDASSRRKRLTYPRASDVYGCYQEWRAGINIEVSWTPLKKRKTPPKILSLSNFRQWHNNPDRPRPDCKPGKELALYPSHRPFSHVEKWKRLKCMREDLLATTETYARHSPASLPIAKGRLIQLAGIQLFKDPPCTGTAPWVCGNDYHAHLASPRSR